jgi:uncharacterized membrane protein YjjP (DUF1212 family)
MSQEEFSLQGNVVMDTIISDLNNIIESLIKDNKAELTVGEHLNNDSTKLDSIRETAQLTVELQNKNAQLEYAKDQIKKLAEENAKYQMKP